MIPLRDVIPSRTFPFFTIIVHRPQQRRVPLRAVAARPRARAVHARRTASCPRSSAVLTVFTSMFLHGGWAALSRQHAVSSGSSATTSKIASATGGSSLFYLLCGVAAVARARLHESDVDDSDDRRERRDRRRDGRVFRPVSAFARAGARAAVHHLGNHRSARDSVSRHLVPDAVLLRCRDRWRRGRAWKREASRSGRTSQAFWRAWRACWCCKPSRTRWRDEFDRLRRRSRGLALRLRVETELLRDRICAEILASSMARRSNSSSYCPAGISPFRAFNCSISASSVMRRFSSPASAVFAGRSTPAADRETSSLRARRRSRSPPRLPCPRRRRCRR